jgi:hypothetical protein
LGADYHRRLSWLHFVTHSSPAMTSHFFKMSGK